jgi:preprotein translocase subunit SecG
MVTAIIIVHVIVCVGLILVVLLQAGKGASVGAAFGGASQTVFGSSGATSFLAKMTTAVAVIFMFTSLGLAMFSDSRQPNSVMNVDTPPVQSAPAVPDVPAP